MVARPDGEDGRGAHAARCGRTRARHAADVTDDRRRVRVLRVAGRRDPRRAGARRSASPDRVSSSSSRAKPRHRTCTPRSSRTRTVSSTRSSARRDRSRRDRRAHSPRSRPDVTARSASRRTARLTAPIAFMSALGAAAARARSGAAERPADPRRPASTATIVAAGRPHRCERRRARRSSGSARSPARGATSSAIAQDAVGRRTDPSAGVPQGDPRDRPRRTSRSAGRDVIDTRGADPLPSSEGAGVAVAIAKTFEAMLACPSPTLAVLIGEGGSGGALRWPSPTASSPCRTRCSR